MSTHSIDMGRRSKTADSSCSEAVGQSRNVLLTSDYPDLQAYAHAMGKIVDARNMFLDACSYILRQDSAIKHLDSPCKLSKKHLDVVRELRESEA